MVAHLACPMANFELGIYPRPEHVKKLVWHGKPGGVKPGDEDHGQILSISDDEDANHVLRWELSLGRYQD